MPTLGETVREIGATFGRTGLSDSQVEYIVWEHTGYPCFWNSSDGNTPEECFKTQVREYFESHAKKKK